MWRGNLAICNLSVEPPIHVILLIFSTDVLFVATRENQEALSFFNALFAIATSERKFLYTKTHDKSKVCVYKCFETQMHNEFQIFVQKVLQYCELWCVIIRTERVISNNRPGDNKLFETEK